LNTLSSQGCQYCTCCSALERYVYPTMCPVEGVAHCYTQDDVHAVLKTLQQSTRLLQHFCGHSKVSKDIALTNHVPPCKRSLETLVFTVKVECFRGSKGVWLMRGCGL
jgi:hypothetical protein